MSDLSSIVVDGYRYTGDDLHLSGAAFWGLALDQRAFGPGQLVVVTARRDGAVVSLAHCERTEPPELGLKCCLATLDDRAAAAVAYSDEPVSVFPPTGLSDRLDTARVAAREFGVHLADWVMCDDTQIRSMLITLEGCNNWWDTPDAGPSSAKRPYQADSRNRSRRRPRRSRPGPGGR